MVQVLKETSYDYSMFIQEIAAVVSKKMGKEYSARILKVTKNNNLELDSLVLLKEGKNFAPNIYLLPYYEAYIEGISIEELSERLCNIYNNCSVPIVGDNFAYTFEEMKSNLTYRLVNYEKNKKLLEKIPYIKFLDLAITFHCLVQNNADGIGTIRVTNEHLEIWEVSKDEIHRFAIDNTLKRFPPIIRSMDEVIKQMLSDEMDFEDLPEELRQSFASEVLEPKQTKMYILSNFQGINGATSLLYLNILKDFGDKINSDFYILPSSIHEVILVPYDKSITKESLSEMVRDINQTQVACDEVLSDKVYYFSRENNTISV